MNDTLANCITEKLFRHWSKGCVNASLPLEHHISSIACNIRCWINIKGFSVWQASVLFMGIPPYSHATFSKTQNVFFDSIIDFSCEDDIKSNWHKTSPNKGDMSYLELVWCQGAPRSNACRQSSSLWIVSTSLLSCWLLSGTLNPNPRHSGLTVDSECEYIFSHVII